MAGGGVCFNIRTGINYVVHKDLKFAYLQNLSIEVTKPRALKLNHLLLLHFFFFLHFCYYMVYRSPNSPSELFRDLEAFVVRMDTEGNGYYTVADLQGRAALYHT